MRKAAHPSGGVVSSNPRCWRGERLHHHGGGVCWLFVLLWIDLWHHKLIVCKIWYKNNLMMRFTALLFDPRMRAPYQILFFHLYLNRGISKATQWNCMNKRFVLILKENSSLSLPHWLHTPDKGNGLDHIGCLDSNAIFADMGTCPMKWLMRSSILYWLVV